MKINAVLFTKNTDDSRGHYKTYIRISKILGISLALMYGAVPVFVDASGLFGAPYYFKNFWFSVGLIFIIISLPNKCSAMGRSLVFTERRNLALSIIIFLSASYCFYLFPWYVDRESSGASVSAFFRALWFVLGISYIGSSERARLLIMFATVILMFVDQSRTYFTLLLIIIAARSEYKKFALLAGLTLAIALGAIRSDDSIGGFDILLYGIVGEGYNATKAVGQIIEVSHIPIDYISHIISILFQPVTIPFDVLLSKLFPGQYRIQDYYLSESVSSNLHEVFNPMGGWYIVGDFVYYGYSGILLMGLYLHITWSLSRRILDSRLFPFGAFFIFIAIKSTPFVYWNFILYIALVSLLYRFLASVRIKSLF